MNTDPIDRLTFPIGQIPFSYHGSWLNLSAVIGEHNIADDVHLVTHQGGCFPIFSLTPQQAGVRVRTDVVASPDSMTWQHPDGDIEAAFESVDTLRLRGRGLTMRIAASTATLTAFTGQYLFTDPIDGSLVVTSYESGRRYRITSLIGHLETFGDQALQSAGRGAVTVASDSGVWEVAIEEYRTSRPRHVSGRSFPEVVDGAAGDFASFLADIAPWDHELAPATQLAAYTLWSATVAPAGFLQRPSVLMSKHWMDKVWSWDHCFNALALAAGRPELALDQFLNPFDHQDEHGALPDSVTHSEVLYNFVKPPIHGWALQGLRRRLPEDLPPDTLRAIYFQLSRWTRFWLDARRVPGHDLAHYQHGNDSGWDNSTVFDAGRVAETADLAAFLTQQMRVLAELATELGRPADSYEWTALGDRMQKAMFDQLWAGGRFAAKNPYTGELSSAESLLNLMPIALGDQLPATASQQLAEALNAHLTEWGAATEPVTSVHYRPDGYWRGPIWAPSTVLIENGLRRAGHIDMADKISASFRALCEKSGFAENFDAVTGEGLRDRAYTWTASAYLILAAEYEQRVTSQSEIVVQARP